VFSLGNAFYSLLTGRIVWENVEMRERDRRIISGETLYIPDYYKDSPSFSALAGVIEACWKYSPEDRPSIFEVVNMLEEAVTSQRRTAG
jgi:hypothetical protein